MPRLADKVALITGAASGIGLATADRFVSEGATVIMADISKEKLASCHATLCARGAQHRAVCIDVTSEDDWIRVTKEIDAAYGRLDVLVNNAGSGTPLSIEDTSLQQWRAGIAVNLDSVFLGTKYSLPLLVRSGRGSIVNTSSIIGLVSTPNAGCYSAAKAGVCLFTKATAMECAAARNGVRANSIHPGQVRTPLLMDNINEVRYRELLTRIPIGRFGEPKEVADAIVFLASDESSFMTGAEVVVDGGYTAQ
jgi:meso-butanediol dehydrogenase / (S,S)-butanediol dehydrogenase / diacetyl reductase